MRRPLLVAKDDGAHVSGISGKTFGVAGIRGIQPDVHAAVHPRIFGHAAPISCISAGVAGAERALFRGRFDSCYRLPASDDLSGLVLEVWQGRGPESVGSHG